MERELESPISPSIIEVQHNDIAWISQMAIPIRQRLALKTRELRTAENLRDSMVDVCEIQPQDVVMDLFVESFC